MAATTVAIALLWWAGLSEGLEVTQSPPLHWKVAGRDESAEMICEHTDSSYYQMYWFRQLPGEKMVFVVLSDTLSKPVFGNVSADKYEVEKSIAQKGALRVKKLEPADSGVYFCAAGKHSHSESCWAEQKPPGEQKPNKPSTFRGNYCCSD